MQNYTYLMAIIITWSILNQCNWKKETTAISMHVIGKCYYHGEITIFFFILLKYHLFCFQMVVVLPWLTQLTKDDVTAKNEVDQKDSLVLLCCKDVLRLYRLKSVLQVWLLTILPSFFLVMELITCISLGEWTNCVQSETSKALLLDFNF